MNILALVTDAYGSGGGIAQYNRDLLAALAQSPHVGAIEVLPRFGAPAPEPPVKVTQHAPAPRKLAWAARAAALALRGGPDVIFCGHLNAAPLAAALARLAGKPLWLQAHGFEAWGPGGALARRAIAQATLVTCVSRYTRARLLAWSDVDPARVSVLPNTFTLGAERPPTPVALALRHGLTGKRVILTLGRLAAAERYKGHDRIIAALPAVKRACPDAAYLIVGAGDDRPRLEAAAQQAGVAGDVVFAGAAPQAERADYFALAHVFAMPSTGEGFGIVFLEAAAAGLPIIAGNRDGSVDALADGAIGALVDPFDGERLAGALIAALERRGPGDAGAVQRFAFPHFARHVDDLVRSRLA